MVAVRNPAPLLVETDEGAGTRISFELFMQDFWGGPFPTSPSVTFAKSADENGRVLVYLQELMRPFLSYELPNSRNNVVRLSQPCKQYFIRVSDSSSTRDVGESGERSYALLAGWEYYENVGKSTFNPPGNRPQLTTLPITRTIDRDQHAWFFFMFDNQENGEIIYTITYTTGLTQQILRNYGTFEPNRPIGIPIGFPAMQYDNVLPELEIAKITVAVRGVAGLTLLPVRNSQTWKRQYIYANSAGAWDTFTTTGLRTDSMETVEVVEAENFLPWDYKYEDGQFGQYDPINRRGFIQNTGYRPLKEHLALADILNTRTIYEITPRGYKKVILGSEGMQLSKDKLHLNNWEMQLSYAHHETGIAL